MMMEAAAAAAAEKKASKFNKICVFCGSSPGKKTTYTDAALQLGNELVPPPPPQPPTILFLNFLLHHF